jgi:hypothetical protein
MKTLWDQYKEQQKFSASSLGLYSKCPAAFYKRYIEHIATDRNDALHLGTCVHEAIEIAAKEKRDTSNNLQSLLEIAIGKFDEEWVNSEGIVWKPRTLKRKGGDYVQTQEERMNELYLIGQRMVGEYVQSEAFRTLEVKDCEQKYSVRLYPDEESKTIILFNDKDMKDGSISLECYFDITLNNHQLLDFKTSRVEWKNIDFVTKLQFDLYAMVYRYVMSHPDEYPEKFIVEYESNGEIVTEKIDPIRPDDPVVFRADIITKHKTGPKIQTLMCAKTLEMEEYLKQDLYGLITGINSQLFPRNLDPMKCSYCDYKSMCLGIEENEEEE